MNIALIIGKHKSTGIPGKNWRPIFGRPMVEYPLMAAYNCQSIDHILISTDSPILSEISKKYSASLIDRPYSLSQPETPTEDVFEHAWKIIKDKFGTNKVNSIALMFANSPDTLPELLQEGI